MRVRSRAFVPVSALSLCAFVGCSASSQQTDLPDDPAFRQVFTSQVARVHDMPVHYVVGGSGQPVVLMHGWPETWFEWVDVMPLLAKRYRVIAVDLPGLGESGTPASYDKTTLAQDVHQLTKDLGLGPVHLVGHDMGGLVAFPYARLFPNDVADVVVVDAPIPGLTGWYELRSQWPRWHFAFHNLPDLPEALVTGREKVYLSWFYQALAFRKDVFKDALIDRYAKAYSKPSSLHAGFEYYRAFEKDAADNKDFETRKVTVPLLAIGGGNSRLNKYVIDQLRSATTQLSGDLAPESGHWIPEEQPAWLANRMIAFFNH